MCNCFGCLLWFSSPNLYICTIYVIMMLASLSKRISDGVFHFSVFPTASFTQKGKEDRVSFLHTYSSLDCIVAYLLSTSFHGFSHCISNVGAWEASNNQNPDASRNQMQSDASGGFPHSQIKQLWFPIHCFARRPLWSTATFGVSSGSQSERNKLEVSDDIRLGW